MKKRFFEITMLVFGFLIYSNSNGMNAANNPAMNPCIQRPHLAGCGANSSQPTKIINIPSHYGALALDMDKGILGISENNLKGDRAAQKEAVQDCIKLGGSKKSCKVIVASRNSCNALALGSDGRGGGVAYGNSDKFQSIAENKVMQKCREMGGQKCFIAYSHCSRDPRYQVGR